jgi:hypothetical protein
LLIFDAFNGPSMKSENVTRFLIAGLLPYRAGQQPRQCHNDRFSLLERHLDGHRLTRLIQEFETHFRAVTPRQTAISHVFATVACLIRSAMFASSADIAFVPRGASWAGPWKTLAHIGQFNPAGEAVLASDGATFDTISPVDLKSLAKVAHGKAADVDRAAKAAKRAFAGWAALSGEKRKQVLHKVANAIAARAEEIAFIECLDTGQALKFMASRVARR